MAASITATSARVSIELCDELNSRGGRHGDAADQVDNAIGGIDVCRRHVRHVAHPIGDVHLMLLSMESLEAAAVVGLDDDDDDAPLLLAARPSPAAGAAAPQATPRVLIARSFVSGFCVLSHLRAVGRFGCRESAGST